MAVTLPAFTSTVAVESDVENFGHTYRGYKSHTAGVWVDKGPYGLTRLSLRLPDHSDVTVTLHRYNLIALIKALAVRLD